MKLISFTFIIVGLFINSLKADINQDVSELKKELKEIKELYENKIEELEAKIKKLEYEKDGQEQHASEIKGSYDSHENLSEESNFNIEAVLNGKYTSYTRSGEVIPKGFGTAHEGERPREGLYIGESELIMNSDVGEKFSASLTAAIVREDGADKIELEEAYVESLDGSFLDNTFFKFGRAFWNVGILNPQHAHADDFADRPLPYRVFLNKAYNDDGLEVSYLIGSSEIGLGLFRGEDFPFGSTAAQEGSGSDAWSVFYKSKINFLNSDALMFNLYHLSGKSKSPNARLSNEDTVTFTGDSDLSIINLDYEKSYDSNKNFRLSAEYFYRNQDGTFADSEASTGNIGFDDNDSGYYLALVNQFNDHLSLGYRYGKLVAADAPAGLVNTALDSGGNDPETHSIMSEWKFDSASVMRLQLNHEKPQVSIVDNQIIFQYIVYLGSGGHDGHDH